MSEETTSKNMKIGGFRKWALKRLQARIRCRIEKSLHCIPLECDEICASCFNAEAAGKSDAAPEKEDAKYHERQ